MNKNVVYLLLQWLIVQSESTEWRKVNIFFRKLYSFSSRYNNPNCAIWKTMNEFLAIEIETGSSKFPSMIIFGGLWSDLFWMQIENLFTFQNRADSFVVDIVARVQHRHNIKNSNLWSLLGRNFKEHSKSNFILRSFWQTCH